MESKNKDKGLIRKYILSRTDGKEIPIEADFFCLRLDDHQNDKIHMQACRKAILFYANEIKDHLPKLSQELIKTYS